MKKVLCSLLIVMMVVCFMPTLAWAETGTGTEPDTIIYVSENADQRTLTGSGTELDPYQITSAEDLNKIRYYVVNTGLTDTTNSSGVKTTINSQVIDGHFKLTTNLDMSNVTNWTPIGMTDENTSVRWKIAFIGTFDGGGYTISNFTSTANSQGNGVFTRLGAGSTVKNLKFDTCTSGTTGSIDVGVLCGSTWGATISNIELKSVTINGNNCTGALCGYINQVTEGEIIIPTAISDCKVDSSTIIGGDSAGGLVGNSAPGSTSNSYLNCEVSNTTIISNGESAAGLVATTSGTLKNCHAKNVTVQLKKTSGTNYIGGLVALCYASSIDGCSSSGTISTVENGVVSHGGGLVGSWAKSSKISAYEIKNSNSAATVNATANNAGGLVGGIADSVLLQVSSCSATGNVTIANKSDGHYAGGLIGKSGTDTIKNSFATGSVTSNNETIIINGALGGLVGYSTGTLDNCYATGTVTTNVSYTGGLIGNYAGGNTHSVKDCYASGNVNGKTHTGGMFGQFAGTVSNSYATGAVTGTEYVGGFAGNVSSSSSISGCATSSTVAASTEEETGYAGGFVGKLFSNSSINSAIATGTVTGKTAGGFVGVADTGMTNCYTSSTSTIPFTGEYTGYYSPQNCFWTGDVTGMLSNNAAPNGSSDGVQDYYYAAVDFASAINVKHGETIAFAQTDTIGANVAEGTKPVMNLTAKASPASLVSNGSGVLTAASIGEGTVTLVLTVNGKDFEFGTAPLTVAAPAGATDVSDDVAVTAPASLVYEGTGKVYAADYDGIESFVITYYDSNNAVLNEAPKNVGTYTVNITGTGTNIYVDKDIPFEITAAPVTITAVDKSVYVNGTAPSLASPVLGTDYTVSGFFGNDSLTTAPTLAYAETPDMTKTGTYAITVTGGTAGSNYTITRTNGTLTVQNRPSTGGGYYVSPVTTAKNTATTALNSAAKAETYEAEEQAQVDAIVAQAKADISKATTKAEVEKIQAEALAAIDAVQTAEEKAAAEEQAKAEAEAAAKIQRLKKGVENTTLKAKSKLIKRANGKLAIRVDWAKSKGYRVDYYEVWRSVKKNSGYGKKPFFTTSDGDKCYYINTKDLKKGTTYYFKVRGVRILDGEKVYTEATKAWRTVKKA